MKIIENPSRINWRELTVRPTVQDGDIEVLVSAIIGRVAEGRDAELRKITSEIDGVEIGELEVSAAEMRAAESQISPELKTAMATAKENVEKFHMAQISEEVRVETMSGVVCVQRAVPLQSVGLYIPGGSAPLFSTVLMLAIPAQLVGCPEIVLCTPPRKDGSVAPEILYAAQLCGINRIFKVGGAQAIAAMAYGTESIPQVCKIFGPGNRFVTKAKQLVSLSQCAIDMPAGPSEVMVLADESANPKFIASDMLSQAEHGPDSQAMLVCVSKEIALAVVEEVEKQMSLLPRQEQISKSLSASRAIVLEEVDNIIEFANMYAAEHLIISMQNPWEIAGKITAAGSIFIGNYSPESAGDYASGTNHTLPTAGWASSFSGVNIDSFVKKITLQELSKDGLAQIAETVTTMAKAEGLEAHAQAIKLRII